MKKILMFVIIIFCAVSCAITIPIQQNDLNDSQTIFKTLKVFQVIVNESNFSSCLAHDSDWVVYKLYSVPGNKKPQIFYDGLKLTKKFRIVGTYTYETKGGDKKTVPVLLFEEDCQTWGEESLSNIIRIILE